MVFQWGRVKESMKRNVILWVMVPGIIVMHLAWKKIQDNPLLVDPNMKREIPIVEVSLSLY